MSLTTKEQLSSADLAPVATKTPTTARQRLGKTVEAAATATATADGLRGELARATADDAPIKTRTALRARLATAEAEAVEHEAAARYLEPLAEAEARAEAEALAVRLRAEAAEAAEATAEAFRQLELELREWSALSFRPLQAAAFAARDRARTAHSRAEDGIPSIDRSSFEVPALFSGDDWADARARGFDFYQLSALIDNYTTAHPVPSATQANEATP